MSQISLSLSELANTLKSADSPEALRNLWNLAGLVADNDIHGGMLISTLAFEASRLRALLTENTRIKQKPFQDFISELADIIQRDIQDGSGDPRNHWALQHAFADYRRALDNFAPIGSHLNVLEGPWGRFVYSVAGKTEFFVTESGKSEKVLIHFDQWYDDVIPGSRQEMETKIITSLERIVNGSTSLVFMERRIGAKGPIALKKTISNHFRLKDGIYTYRRSNNGAIHILNDSEGQRFVVVHDYARSEGELARVESLIQSSFRPRSVDFLLLCNPNPEQLPSTKGDINYIYDSRQHPELKYQALCDQTSKSVVPGIKADDTINPFYRLKLADVDPGSLNSQERRIAHELCDSDGVRKVYGGKWVVMTPYGVLDADENLERLNERLDKWSSVLGDFKLTRFILPHSYSRGHSATPIG